MFSSSPRGRTTSNEQAHGDGSTTTTTSTTSYKSDGTKVTKRKVNRSKTLPQNRSRSKTPPPLSNRHNPKNGATSPPSRPSTMTLSSMVEALEEVLGVKHSDNQVFQKAIHRAIPSDFVLIASQDDVTQAQEDHYAMKHYNLPGSDALRDGKIAAGSVATCALLQLMYENPSRLVGTNTDTNIPPWDCRQVLQEIKSRVQRASKLEAKPTISSSRPLGPPALKKDNTTGAPQYAPFYIVPPGFTGKRRALLIGVVAGEGDDLMGPPNDIHHVHQFLMQHCGFQDNDIIVLRDDDGADTRKCQPSTRQNILDGFAQMASLSKAKDVVFIQFSGHGGRLGDNLYILPTDYAEQGHIMDDDILKDLIKYMTASVYTTMLVDCCYSGVVGDLPYVLQSNTEEGGEQKIENYYDTDTRREMIEKQAEGGEEYKERKQARSKWRNVMRLPSVAATYASDLAQGFSNAADAAATSARSAASSLSGKASAANATLRRTATSPVVRGRPAPRAASPNLRRTTTSPVRPRSVSPGLRRTVTSSPPRPRMKSDEEAATEFDEAARKAAVGRSRLEAPPRRECAKTPPRQARAKTPPLRTKSVEDLAFEREVAARKAGVERSRKEAARERSASPRRRTKSVEDLAFEREVAARKAGVERSRKEAARARSKSPPRRTKSVEDLAFEREVAARRMAVERSKREAAEARQAVSEK